MFETETHASATETRCLRCGRKIRQAAREHALDGLSVKQAEDAREIVADGGVVPTNREGVWKVTSGDGSQVYMTTADGHCNCAWGLRRTSAGMKVCKHVGSVRLVQVTPRRSRQRLAA